MNDKRVENRRTLADRRDSERRQLADRRQNVIEVSFERRVAGRRFVERRARDPAPAQRPPASPEVTGGVPENVKIGVNNVRSL